MKHFCLLLTFTILFSACDSQPKEKGLGEKQTYDTLNLALDWRPNVLHSGIFYAQAKGWYRDSGLVLNWFTPEVDNYTVKPIKKLLAGQADLSVGPSEHLFHYGVDSGGVKAQAVASLLQNDRSAFVVKASADIKRPADFSGRRYLGYQTPLEQEILAGMIADDGGDPQFETTTPGRLSLWEAFQQDSGDIAWVFLHWEAMKAQIEGVELRSFIPSNYGVPYGYSSVIMARKEMDETLAKNVKDFLAISGRAYQALRDSAGSTEIVRAFVDHPNFKDSVFIAQAQANISPHYFNQQGKWGTMRTSVWADYLAWLREQNMPDYKVMEAIPATAFYTNRFLE